MVQENYGFDFTLAYQKITMLLSRVLIR